MIQKNRSVDWKTELVEITANGKKKDKEWKEMRIVWDLWDNITCTNIHIIGVPEEETMKGAEDIFENIITESCPKLAKERVT